MRVVLATTIILYYYILLIRLYLDNNKEVGHQTVNLVAFSIFYGNHFLLVLRKLKYSYRAFICSRVLTV